jgi:hypothetical protein
MQMFFYMCSLLVRENILLLTCAAHLQVLLRVLEGVLLL